MTTFNRRYNAHLRDDATHRYTQARAEGERESAAYETWLWLFTSGRYSEARRWWFSEIEGQEAH